MSEQNRSEQPAPAVGARVDRVVRPGRPKLDRQQRAVLKRMTDARRFPDNTDPCSRHVALLADALLREGFSYQVNEEPQHCGESMAYTVAMLWEARTELAQLKAYANALNERCVADAHDAERWRNLHGTHAKLSDPEHAAALAKEAAELTPEKAREFLDSVRPNAEVTGLRRTEER